ncbi:hypothetical protein HMPREF9318_01150 [Streptococcus urinalis FB127-CNA-2]|nr:hypothetical protein HMPREF9318_01150 [Streptococcus urinalis FB127-CNA-2]VEF31205.1 NADH:flavin oxidoreductase / NADH oxidase family protein [Streptococcus urinalis]
MLKRSYQSKKNHQSFIYKDDILLANNITFIRMINRVVLFGNKGNNMTKKLLDNIALSSGQQLKNRMVMAPMTTQSAYFDGTITEELIRYYAQRSGTIGTVIVESAFVENK